jgi:hypothetical protein
MVTKSRKANAGKKKKIKVLSLKKETVKDLTSDEEKRVKGGTAYYYQSTVSYVVQFANAALSGSKRPSVGPSGNSVSG